MLTSCGSRGAQLTCCVGDLCCVSGDMAIFTTRARCSAIGVVVISLRVCPRASSCETGVASMRPRLWLVNVSRDLSGGVGAIVGRVRGRGALRVNDGSSSCHESLGVSASEIGKRQGAFAGAAGKSHNDARARRYGTRTVPTWAL